MQFSLCPLGPYCVIYFVCVYFACLCGLWPLMYIITTKTLKNFCVDCWLDLGQMDLELRQHSYAKGLGQCQLIEKPSACNLKLHLIHHSRSLWVHLQHDHCEAVILNLWLVEFICYMGYFEEDHGMDKLGCGHLYLMPCSSR